MEMREIKKELRKDISAWIGRQQKLTKEFIRERVEKTLGFWAQEGRVRLDKAKREKIINSLCNDLLGSGPIEQLMNDEEVTEIMINGPHKVYIERDGKKVPSDVVFEDEAHLRYTIEKMLHPVGRRVDESYPYVDFSLKDGSRVNVIIPPLAVGGTVVTIRKFLRSIEKVEDLVRLHTIDKRMSEFLVDCIKAKVNVLFSGATGSGKTTTLEVLSSYINTAERIITIEDALELKLMQEHVVRLLTRPPNIEGRGEVTIRDLFINTLRMRPTRIILGEVRGGESMDYLQALNSGHRGCLAVIHASTPFDALTRLETTALYAGLNMPTWAIRKQIASGVDLIVQHEQLLDGSRKITYITEIERLEGNNIVLRDIFRYEIEEVDSAGKVVGTFKAKNIPTFFPIFKKKGITLKEDLFQE